MKKIQIAAVGIISVIAVLAGLSFFLREKKQPEDPNSGAVITLEEIPEEERETGKEEHPGDAKENGDEPAAGEAGGKEQQEEMKPDDISEKSDTDVKPEESAKKEKAGKRDSSETDSSEKIPEAVWTEYDAFLAMTPAEQDAYMKSFESPEAFTQWLIKAQKEWAEAHPTEEIAPDGTIDLGG